MSLVSDVHENNAQDFIKKVFSLVTYQHWQNWKSNGFSDEQLAIIALKVFSRNEITFSRSELTEFMMILRKIRIAKGVLPVRKKIDTSAAEFPSRSNYLYMTYNGSQNDALEINSQAEKRALALGSGAYRIGSSVEFDWCLVNCLEELRGKNWLSVVINCNPETVSTDHDTSDLLYFEELTLERILDIIDLEKIDGTIVAMGGQLPNQLAPSLAQLGVTLLGHNWETIDQAEDRGKFSGILDKCGINQPRWIEAQSLEDARQFINKVGFPVLIRPSYVLSGSAMNVISDDDSLEHFLYRAKEVSQDYPVVITEYFEEALEVELDGASSKGKLLFHLMSSHVENAGVHSGDATLVHPAQGITIQAKDEMKKIGTQLSQALNLNGPFNIQFLIAQEKVFVIECNVRAARSYPFVSKISGVNLARLATQVMLDLEVTSPLESQATDRVGVKASMFSFQRLSGADPVLGVEMASTGEVGCLGQSFEEALLLSFESVGNRKPQKGALLSAGRPQEKYKLIPTVESLSKLQIPIFATEGTADFLRDQGYSVEKVGWENIEKKVRGLISGGKIDFVVNLPKNYTNTELENGYQIRTLAIRHGCTLLTNIEKTNAFLKALVERPKFCVKPL